MSASFASRPARYNHIDRFAAFRSAQPGWLVTQRYLGLYPHTDCDRQRWK